MKINKNQLFLSNFIAFFLTIRHTWKPAVESYQMFSYIEKSRTKADHSHKQLFRDF